MSISKVGAIAVLAFMLTAPVVGHATNLSQAFDNFGHSVVSGVKQAGHTVKNGARNVGRSIATGWHSLKRDAGGR
jgi:hypothetical protein